MPEKKRARSHPAERILAVALRTLHLAAVVGLGAALHGAALPRGAAGLVVLGSGLVLAAMDLAAGRMRLFEVAGAVVVVKLAVVAWLTLADAGQAATRAGFWALLVASSLSAHAPKAVRHWRPGSARASSAGRPG